MRAAKVQASLRIRAVSPEPPLLAHTSSESRGTFRQKARSLAPLNGWACAVEICHDGMLEDTNSLDAVLLTSTNSCCKAATKRVRCKNKSVWRIMMHLKAITSISYPSNSYFQKYRIVVQTFRTNKNLPAPLPPPILDSLCSPKTFSAI